MRKVTDTYICSQNKERASMRQWSVKMASRKSSGRVTFSYASSFLHVTIKQPTTIRDYILWDTEVLSCFCSTRMAFFTISSEIQERRSERVLDWGGEEN